MSISYSSGSAYIDSPAGGKNQKLEAARRYARARKKEELDALRRNSTMTVRGVRKHVLFESREDQHGQSDDQRSAAVGRRLRARSVVVHEP